MSEFDTYCTDDPVCPYCGNVEGDAWEMLPEHGGSFEYECTGCGKDVFCQPDYCVTYETSKVQEGSDQ